MNLVSRRGVTFGDRSVTFDRRSVIIEAVFQFKSHVGCENSKDLLAICLLTNNTVEMTKRRVSKRSDKLAQLNDLSPEDDGFESNSPPRSTPSRPRFPITGRRPKAASGPALIKSSLSVNRLFAISILRIFEQKRLVRIMRLLRKNSAIMNTVGSRLSPAISARDSGIAGLTPGAAIMQPRRLRVLCRKSPHREPSAARSDRRC